MCDQVSPLARTSLYKKCLTFLFIIELTYAELSSTISLLSKGFRSFRQTKIDISKSEDVMRSRVQLASSQESDAFVTKWSFLASAHSQQHLKKTGQTDEPFDIVNM